MSFNSIQELFSAFNNLTVLVIGDVMLDYYVYGSVDRISPEAPVPVVNVKRREKRLGGAANVALNIKAMGATPILCSMIGDDLEGAAFEQLLVQKRNLSSEGILKNENRVTTIKERILSGSQHILRVDSEIDEDLNEKDSHLMIERIVSLIPKADAIILEDYNKGVLSEVVIRETIKAAKLKGVPVLVDPKKRNFFAYEEASLFKPNFKELKEGYKLDLEGWDEKVIRDAVARLKEEMNVEAVMVTLSERGIYIDSADGQYLIPAHVRKISDVSGAGDTVISVASLCQALKLPTDKIAALSNLAGGLVCEHVGVVPVDKEALLNEAEENNIF